MNKKFKLKDKYKILCLIYIIINFIFIIINAIVIIQINSYENEDVNRDGEVNALDLLIVQKYILNEEES